MTVSLQEETDMQENFQSVDNFIDEKKYCCQMLLEKTTLGAANDKSFPTDARLIWYKVDNVEYMDLVRCRKTSELFDMYYDKYGAGAVQKIDFGYGQVSPKLWGYKSKNKDDKKK